MIESVVLRFRDATEDRTVESHKRILTESPAHYVWWGWWKKDSEPDQHAALEEIRSRAREAGIPIGLFDRSTRSFFVANACDCVFSNEPINSPDPRYTPSYYSSENVPAWFKLTYIDEVEEKSFIEIFSMIPLGEGTFFPVVRGKNQQVNGPPSIDIQSSTVLHISDIHFGADYGFPPTEGPGKVPLLEVIKRDFRDEKIGLVIVSGDITSRADANVSQDEGLRFLKNISDQLGVPKECFVIVPGNHDIALKKFRPLDYSHEAAFHIFAKEFYGKQIQYPNLQRYTLPNGRSIELLAINSVRLRNEKEKEFGYVQWTLYDDLLRMAPRDPNALRIAVLHHHLVAAPREQAIDPDFPEAGISTTLDAGAVIEGLQTYGFSIALHGHQHVPKASRVARAFSMDGNVDLGVLGNGLVLLAAGSAGSNRLSDEMRDNSYNVLRIGNSDFESEARRFNPGSAPQPLFRIRQP